MWQSPYRFHFSSYVIVSLCLRLQIRFDSLVLPLLRLGCFAKGVNCFPSIPTTPNGLSLNFSESEFKASQPPSEGIDEKSFVFAAAEILRFLRDMALNFTTAQSKSLLQVYRKDKGLSGSPPTMASALLHSTPSSHLVHPGAVLCMLDLLPAISLDSSQLPGDREDEVGVKEVANGNSCNSPDSTEKTCENIVKNHLTGEREVEKMTDGGMKLSSQPRGNEDLDDDNQGWALAHEKSLEGKDTDLPSSIDTTLSYHSTPSLLTHSLTSLSTSGSPEKVRPSTLSLTSTTASGELLSIPPHLSSLSSSPSESSSGIIWQSEGVMEWETDYCKMSTDVAGKVCVWWYC